MPQMLHWPLTFYCPLKASPTSKECASAKQNNTEEGCQDQQEMRLGFQWKQTYAMLAFQISPQRLLDQEYQLFMAHYCIEMGGEANCISFKQPACQFPQKLFSLTTGDWVIGCSMCYLRSKAKEWEEYFHLGVGGMHQILEQAKAISSLKAELGLPRVLIWPKRCKAGCKGTIGSVRIYS